MKIFFVFIIGLTVISCGSLPPELKKLEERTIFKVSKDQQHIVLDGVINSLAYKNFTSLEKQYPNIKTLIIINCDGSINDDINLKLAKHIYKQGFSIHLNDGGLIASGGTDLFLAGRKRTLGKNTKVGVHSWEDKESQATDFPKEHTYHKPYIEYYQAIGFSQKEAKDFYFFTINSAPANDIHWMTKAEIEQFNVVKL